MDSAVTGKIAFATDRDGNYEIYIMNTDGTGLQRLTDNPADDSNPSFSPDGKKIVFQSNRDGSFDIYIMNADGTEQTNLTKSEAHDRYPSFSP